MAWACLLGRQDPENNAQTNSGPHREPGERSEPGRDRHGRHGSSCHMVSGLPAQWGKGAGLLKGGQNGLPPSTPGPQEGARKPVRPPALACCACAKLLSASRFPCGAVETPSVLRAKDFRFRGVRPGGHSSPSPCPKEWPQVVGNDCLRIPSVHKGLGDLTVQAAAPLATGPASPKGRLSGRVQAEALGVGPQGVDRTHPTQQTSRTHKPVPGGPQRPRRPWGRGGGHWTGKWSGEQLLPGLPQLAGPDHGPAS